MATVLSSGAAHYAAYFQPVIEQVKVPVKRSRKGTRPKEVAADKAYDDATYVRKGLSRRGTKAMIPERLLKPGAKRRKKGSHHRFNKPLVK